MAGRHGGHATTASGLVVIDPKTRKGRLVSTWKHGSGDHDCSGLRMTRNKPKIDWSDRNAAGQVMTTPH